METGNGLPLKEPVVMIGTIRSSTAVIDSVPELPRGDIPYEYTVDRLDQRV